ncbi:hypothetical protein F4777DRAFT_579642 [Nemania sp. FL0916]|nr:hypothetical protein F4777DRAFT_579642 [Nemania sp. FL0916]
MNQQPSNQVQRLLRPEAMRTIQYLSASDRQRYEEGLQTLWAKVEQNPAESQEHQQAKQKIAEFSRMVATKVKNMHVSKQAQAGAHQGQSAMTGLQQQANQQAQAQAQAQAQSQAQAAAAAAAQKPVMPSGRFQGPPVGNNAMNQGTMPTNSQAAAGISTAGPVTSQQPVLSRQITDHVNKLPWGQLPVPSQLNQEQAQKWLTETKNKYTRALMQMEAIKTRSLKVDATLKERQEKGIVTSQEELKRLQDQKMMDRKMYGEVDVYIKMVRTQITNASAAAQVNSAPGQDSTTPGRPQPMQQGNSNGAASTQAMQVPTTSINAAIDAAKTTQIAAAGRAGSVGGAHPSQQAQQSQQHQPQALSSNQTRAQTPVAPTTPSIGTAGQPSHTGPTPPPTHIKMEPGASAQHLPPVNTAIAAAASSAHIQSAGTPTQAPTRVQTPQSAQQAPGANVRPLTHAAAVIRANSSTNVNAQSSNPSGNMASNNPNMAGISSQPGHSHAHPQPTPTLSSKMPIPKTLHDKAIAPPQPVAVGGGNTPGRPTYGGGNGAGGVMNQPVIAKMAAPQFDTEGDHVLSKKKLDELVRQICGGGSPGPDGNYLTPDVEESVLTIADNFVDDVLHKACSLAKERGSKVLEIRDIQIVLERVYNIRIPGYTSDELRTVRKVQPSPNWLAKMSAIQAAKVTGGKDDK